MKLKRVHFIKDEGEWVVFFCDTVTYKRINNIEKECYEFVAKGKSKEDFYLMNDVEDADLYDRCVSEMMDDGKIACQIPEEKLRLTLNIPDRKSVV